MKKMYLKVWVESSENNDFLDVYYHNGRCFLCHKDDEKLVEIDDAESKGAEKMCKAIADICHSDDELVESAFDGYCTYAGIISKFTPKEIIERVEKIKKIKQHVPATGDIYESRHSGSKVVVMHYNMKTESVQFMDDTCPSNITLNTLNKLYSFTGRNYNEFSSILNELKGDNT